MQWFYIAFCISIEIQKTTMVEAYWNIGKSIIEEQDGKDKAEYGTGLLKELSKKMTQDFGKGFTVANLKNMRQIFFISL